MSPPLIFLLAILTPILLCLVLLGPASLSVLAATYMIYMPDSGAHPLATHLLDPFYIGDVYMKLFNYWLNNRATVDFVDYTLPVIGLPILGVLVSLWLTHWLTKKMLNLFHLSARIN